MRKPPDDDWIWAKTNTDAIALIISSPVDVISIDHDICFYDRGSGLVDPVDETFRPVAYFLANCPIEYVPQEIRLHSGNPIGAGEMVRILDKYKIRIQQANLWGAT